MIDGMFSGRAILTASSDRRYRTRMKLKFIIGNRFFDHFSIPRSRFPKIFHLFFGIGIVGTFIFNQVGYEDNRQ